MASRVRRSVAASASSGSPRSAVWVRSSNSSSSLAATARLVCRQTTTAKRSNSGPHWAPQQMGSRRPRNRKAGWWSSLAARADATVVPLGTVNYSTICKAQQWMLFLLYVLSLAVAHSVTVGTTGDRKSCLKALCKYTVDPCPMSLGGRLAARDFSFIQISLSCWHWHQTDIYIIYNRLQFDLHAPLLSTEHRANVTQRQVLCYASFKGSLSEFAFRRFCPAAGTGLRSQAYGELTA